LNYYKHHIGDYAGKTAHLSLLEHGAYLLLLQHYYATERPLPDDLRALARIIRADGKAEAAAIRRVLDQFWTLTDDGWINERAVEEIERAAAQRDTNRELGKRGGRPRKTESVNQPKTESVSEWKPKHNPTPDSNTPVTNTLTEREGGYVPGTRRKSGPERYRDAVAVADEYARNAIATELESGLQRTHEVAISPGVDGAMVEPGRIRAAVG